MKGGQSNDEGKDNYYEYDDKKGFVLKQDKRQEIFYNNIIAQDEITRLTEKKAFTNFKKFTKDGEVPFSGFTKDENGEIKDNLIIKGNNLLALYSLKEKFSGKVKMIYIDPPYNTGNDSFGYNDKFNHSTWLTFMKNRLEIARELLRDDGAIFVQCDDNEQAYLKVLMDEVFGKENFISNMVRKVGIAVRIDAKHISKETDYILFYAKNEEVLSLNRELANNMDTYPYSDEFEEVRGKYKLNKLDRGSISYSAKMDYPIISPDGTEIFPGGTPEYNGWCWRWSKNKLEWGIKNNYIEFKKVKGVWSIYFKQYQFVDNNLKKIERSIPYKNLLTDGFNNEVGNKELKELFWESNVFSFPKSEILLKRIIDIVTNSGDIVLDYHLGSGTTCAVAHKMGRQYIGIEQMDYIETIPVERLKKVIEGEQGGISKDVEWKGGGEFVYFELAKLNKNAIKTIQSLKDYESLKAFFLEMKDKYFLKYNLKIQKFIDEILNSDKFKNLPLDEQKAMLITMLDNNQLYVNADDMKDENMKMKKKEKDINFTREFYN